MNVEEALSSSIEYEKRIKETYLEALEGASDPTAQKVYRLLAEEEDDHMVYLQKKLTKWRETKELSADDLDTNVPTPEVIREAMDKLKQKGQAKAADSDIAALKKAFELEKETSTFYESLVRDLPSEGKRFFERFVEIENGHLALVQAEIDALEGMGFWFDTSEFDLEKG